MRNFKFLISSTALAALVACGGGGGGAGTFSSVPSLSGVAATGSAMMGATITLTDSAGKTTTTTAKDDGSYSFDDLTGYTAPIQISASVLVGEKQLTHYAIVPSTLSNGTNTANISHLTSAIVGLVAPTGTLSDLTTAQLSAITPSQVAAATTQVQTVIAPLANNISGAGNFNPLTTTFTANGQGADGLLDHLSVVVRPDGVDISNKMAISTGDSTAAASSTIVKGGVTAPTPLAATDTVDLSGLDTLVTSFKKCFAVPSTSRLTNKTPSSADLHADCQGIALPSYLHNGNTFISRWAGMLNTTYADSNSKIFRPEIRLRISSNPEVIAVNFNMTDNQGNGYTMPEVIQKQTDGTWKLLGNQRKLNAYAEAQLNYYQDLTNNTTYNNVNYSRIDTGYRFYFDPRVTFDNAGNPTNQAIDMTRNDGTTTSSWSTIRTANSDNMVKCVIVTGPGKFVGSSGKWMGIHPYGLVLKRAVGSPIQDYLAIDRTLTLAKNTALLAAQRGDALPTFCPDTGVIDSGGTTASSSSNYAVEIQALTNQTHPISGTTDTTIDGRDKRWYTGPRFARVAPDADLKSTLNNNPKFTFYVIDTNNTLQYKFEQRFIGDLPAASEVQSMVDAKKLPTLSKDSITAYLDYTNTQNAVSSVSVNWTNPTNGFNADRVGFYAEVFQSTPGNGLRGPNSIIAANKPPNNVGTDGIWNSDSDIAAEIDALTGTNFFWRLNSITKADDGAGNCTGDYLVSSLNVGTPRAKNTMSNQSLGGNWLGTDTQATACKKVVGIGSPPTYPAAAKTYLHREIWLRTYTTTNARVYRYYANKNFS